MTKNQAGWDVVVIGGGPSGLIAAYAAARSGACTIILERNDACGKKLLLTGGGRCNVLNAEADLKKLLPRFKGAESFLHAPFSRFGVTDAITFFESRGIKLKEEPGGRMFPTTNDARTIRDALIAACREAGVSFRTNARVRTLCEKDGLVISAELEDEERVCGGAFVVATGGLSHPETGSSGDGFAWSAALGHTVHAPNPSLVPVKTLERWTHELLGFAPETARLAIIRDGKHLEKKSGRILFTHFGLSGPLTLNMSKSIWTAMQEGRVTLEVDLYPKLDPGALDKGLSEKLRPIQNKLIRNALPEIIEPRLATAVIAKCKLDAEKHAHQLTRDERQKIVFLLKHIVLTPTGLLGADKAIVTSGGIDLREIDTRTMRSHKVPNLYFAGDALDIDRPSGGYSLQLCWTTGHVAGQSAGEQVVGHRA